jgi:FkbM family methyltransferase
MPDRQMALKQPSSVAVTLRLNGFQMSMQTVANGNNFLLHLCRRVSSCRQFYDLNSIVLVVTLTKAVGYDGAASMKFKQLLRRMLRPPLHYPDVNLPYVVLGTSYGGWPILTTVTPDTPLIYSFGVGEDVSFDLAAIKTFQASIHAFDPTPRSLEWTKTQVFPEGFKFHPFGIAERDGEAEFHAPDSDSYVSFSVSPTNGKTGKRTVSAPVKRLATIVAELETGPPDILKMDIEGFEYSVLPDILQSNVRPGQLLVEFHHGMYGISNTQTKVAVDQLKAEGYALYYVSEGGREYGFVRRGIMGQHS